jgi:tetratricopeptide (TPR) repeat protein
VQTMEPEQLFHKGLAALADSHPLQAVDCFLDAMQAEQRVDQPDPDMRFLSYYGLCLSLSGRASHAALEACRLACDADRSNPTMWLNLGRVHALSGDRLQALRCLDLGLKLSPDYEELQIELKRLNRRSRSTFTFLRRDHPFNFWSGTLRGRFARSLGRLTSNQIS